MKHFNQYIRVFLCTVEVPYMPCFLTTLKQIVLPHKLTLWVYRAYRALRAYSRNGKACRDRTFSKVSILAFQYALYALNRGRVVFMHFLKDLTPKGFFNQSVGGALQAASLLKLSKLSYFSKNFNFPVFQFFRGWG